MRYFALALILLSLVACGGGGGSGNGSGSGTPPAPVSHISNFNGTIIGEGGTLSSEGPTSVTVDTQAGTITFHSNVEGTVNSTTPNGTYHSADGTRIYTVQFDDVNHHLNFFRSANNANYATWSLSAVAGNG